ncbi:MAG: TetR/AcrR family transcriptional regulator [Cyclobacteriaceae bacterium]
MSPRSKAQFEEIRDQARDKIMSAALQLFGTNGYEATTISQIAKAAGYSKGLLYNYFDSKEDLLKELVASLSKGEEELIKQIVNDDPGIMLENIIRYTFKEFRENLELWKLITSLAIQVERFAFIHDLAVNKLNSYLVLFEQLLTGIGIPHPKEEARLLAAAFDGVGMQKLFVKEDYQLDDFEKYLITKYCKQ